MESKENMQSRENMDSEENEEGKESMKREENNGSKKFTESDENKRKGSGKIIEIFHRKYLDNILIIRAMRKPVMSYSRYTMGKERRNLE